MVGFDSDGNPGQHTIWLTNINDRQYHILNMIKTWIREGKNIEKGIPFDNLSKSIAQIQHAFLTIPYEGSLIA